MASSNVTLINVVITAKISVNYKTQITIGIGLVFTSPIKN